MRTFSCNYKDNKASYFTEVVLECKWGEKRAQDKKTSKTTNLCIFKIYHKEEGWGCLLH